MNRLACVVVGAVAVLASAVAAAAPYSIDPVHSVTLFKVQHLGAGFTYGVFTDVSGTLEYDWEKPESSSIEMVVKTGSINTFNEARDKHLATADFFDVEQFPEMSFKSTAWKKVDDNSYEVTGDFTLHGVTKRITIPVENTGTGKGRKGEIVAGFETTFKINRSDYGMTNMIPAAGDEVTITVAIEAIQK